MFNESRIDIYNFLYDIFYDVVTKNVYMMAEPEELTESDTKNGFIVIRVGDLNDNSEFNGQAYGWARCYVEAYIPKKSRGRLDVTKYEDFENGINATIRSHATNIVNETFYIQEGSVISMDYNETSNANNQFLMFIKSFVLVIDKES